MTLKTLARAARLAPATLLLALAAGACSSDSNGPDVSVVGTWQLQTVNGQALPYVVAQSGSDKIEVTSDVLPRADEKKARPGPRRNVIAEAFDPFDRRNARESRF